MELLDLIFVLVGNSTLILFHYKIDWLFDKKKFLIILLYNCLLFALSYLLIYLNVGNPNTVVALRISLLSSLVFYVLCNVFRSIYNRNPENTFYSFSKKPIEDIVFSGLFWVFGVGVPILII